VGLGHDPFSNSRSPDSATLVVVTTLLLETGCHVESCEYEGVPDFVETDSEVRLSARLFDMPMQCSRVYGFPSAVQECRGVSHHC
jgi:hypothetical protein